MLRAMNTHPAPIPLRPDPDALRARNVTALHRACFAAANRALDPYETRAATSTPLLPWSDTRDRQPR